MEENNTIVPRQQSIWAQITQEDVFSKLFTEAYDYPITSEQIKYLALHHKMFSSPFREDSSPSMGFMYTSLQDINANWRNIAFREGIHVDKLRLRDFATDVPNIGPVFYGDAVDFVMKYLSEVPEYTRKTYNYHGKFEMTDNQMFAIALKELWKMFDLSNTQKYTLETITKVTSTVCKVFKSFYSFMQIHERE